MFDKKKTTIGGNVEPERCVPPPQPIEGAILTELQRERIAKLVALNHLNNEIQSLETKIAWFQRNPVAETYFPEVLKVKAIFDKLTKEKND